MSLKNRITLTFISILVVAMGILSLASIKKVNTVFSAKRFSSIPQGSTTFSSSEKSKITAPLNTILSSSKTLFNINLIVIFLILALIGSILVYVVINYSLKPLDRLQKKMKDSNINSLGHPLKLSGGEPSEIKSLTLSFNKMSKKINDSFIKQQLFLHNAAHEFRTPLAIISTYSQLLDMELKKEDSIQKEMVNTILDNCSSIEVMLTELMLLSEDKQVALNDFINIRNLIQISLSELSPLSKEKNMTIKATIPNNLVVQGNKDLLRIVFKNLIENAIKYGERNSEIVLDVTDLDRKVIFTIKNKSNHINSIEANKIFEPFYRGEIKEGHIEGHGIGLSIVQQVVSQHSGQIYYKTSNDDVTFTIDLPKRV